MKLNTKKTEGGHNHSWKYKGAGHERVCEAPFPTIESCGEVEISEDKINWSKG